MFVEEGGQEGGRAPSRWWVSIGIEVTKYPLNERVKCSVGLEVTETAGGESKDGLFHVSGHWRNVWNAPTPPARTTFEQ